MTETENTETRSRSEQLREWLEQNGIRRKHALISVHQAHQSWVGFCCLKQYSGQYDPPHIFVRRLRALGFEVGPCRIGTRMIRVFRDFTLRDAVTL